jgi:signal transduction histidine kinase/CheY-like chemotaxis protein
MRTAISTHLCLAGLVLGLALPVTAQTNGHLVLVADSLSGSAAVPIAESIGYWPAYFSESFPLVGTWRYHAGDNQEWADPRYDDSEWGLASTWVDPNRTEANSNYSAPDYPGIGWFRLDLRVDSSLHQIPLGLVVWRGAATEVYLDGELVHSVGQVGPSKETEQARWDYRPSRLSLRGDTDHVLAVRFSNFTSARPLQAGYRAGFLIVLGEYETMLANRPSTVLWTTFHYMLIGGIMLALMFLHGLLFVFYPEPRSNLYFAGVALGWAGVLFTGHPLPTVDSLGADWLKYWLLFVFILTYAVSLLYFAHSILRRTLPTYLRVVTAVAAALCVGMWFSNAVRPYGLVLAIFAMFDAMRVLIYSMTQRRTGAWIIGMGLIPLALESGHILVTELGVMAPLWDWHTVPIYGYIGLCLVLSMSIYLARDFARTKRDLERTNIQLEDYSRTLEDNVDSRTQNLRAEMQKTEAQAQRLRELDQAKSRFFANISHEFRTPLTLILGPIESALDGRYGALPDALKTALRRVQHQAHRLLRLVEQLLDLSRVEHNRLALYPRTQNLVGFLRHHVRSFTPLAERHGVHLALRAEAERLPVSFDPDQLEKVITNLLSNALKFTPESGKVFVIVRRQELVDGQWAEVAVHDTGPGIDPEDLERIFNRFEQADGTTTRRHEGTGIGLSLAKELTELHGGTLLVESEPGFGSTFFVRLPLSTEDGERSRGHMEPVPFTANAANGTIPSDDAILKALPQPSEQSDSGAPPTGDGETCRPLVLVVEDNAEVRAYLREQLAPRYRVLEAEDGAQGLTVARDTRPDLVLADVMMPGADGIALLDALKADEQLREIPVMLLTARAAEEDRVDGIQRGADDYLVKPFNPSELLVRVERLIQTRRSLQARYRRKLRVEPAELVVDSDHEIFLRQVLDTAADHLAEPSFGAEALAEAVGMSRRQLTRKLKALLDEPPSDLLRRLRLERAAQLLEAEHGRISEVAYAVGFKSASHFTRIFRAHFGCTPSVYRDEHA